MIQHEKKITESIKKNIIGTANLCIAANKYNIKLIYTSTNFVYPGTKGNYSEKDALLPFNNYGWSKLGGECSCNDVKKTFNH
jgi:dTDP-4-dehydrorhamnose reductase